ncbi:unnamed protein product, partial [Tetraodon nigroviridis]
VYKEDLPQLRKKLIGSLKRQNAPEEGLRLQFVHGDRVLRLPEQPVLHPYGGGVVPRGRRLRRLPPPAAHQTVLPGPRRQSPRHHRQPAQGRGGLGAGKPARPEGGTSLSGSF